MARETGAGAAADVGDMELGSPAAAEGREAEAGDRLPSAESASEAVSINGASSAGKSTARLGDMLQRAPPPAPDIRARGRTGDRDARRPQEHASAAAASAVGC